MLLIVGLGNPGTRYRCTRHNIGFQCVDLIAHKWGIRQSERRAKAVLGRGNHAGVDIVLAKPRTFMNNSGEGVDYLLTRFAATPADLVIIYDDMELPLGRLRIRASGSDGGHNGMRSIIAALKTQDFPRIRVGIGAPGPGSDDIRHVLTSFSREELPAIRATVETAAEVVPFILAQGLDAAMSRFN